MKKKLVINLPEKMYLEGAEIGHLKIKMKHTHFLFNFKYLFCGTI